MEVNIYVYVRIVYTKRKKTMQVHEIEVQDCSYRTSHDRAPVHRSKRVGQRLVKEREPAFSSNKCIYKFITSFISPDRQLPRCSRGYIKDIFGDRHIWCTFDPLRPWMENDMRWTVTMKWSYSRYFLAGRSPRNVVVHLVLRLVTLVIQWLLTRKMQGWTRQHVWDW